MGICDGRVVIVTGGGRGLGRAHSLAFAAEGAKVVVNDLGGSASGEGADVGPAQEVVDEITAMGGEAIASTDSVTDWDGGERMVQRAVETFGALHVLVNNAGILRDRSLANMSEAEWDAVIDVHMKGHFVPTRFAAAYWKERSKAGSPVKGCVINTASGAMLGNLGQTNYAGAKAGIAAMALVWAGELGRYGIRVNCLAPLARTRLTLETPGLGELIAPPDDPSEFDIWDPANISPLVTYLATEDCPFTGGIFHVGGNEVGLYDGYRLPEEQIIATEGRWEVADLADKAARLLEGRGNLASVVTSIADANKGFGSRPPTP
jgi:NAD(P)-dependent dehydrogenase (short-subunit alcohol dehydrogenase family)